MGHTIAVLAASGGVGASTLAAALAVRSAAAERAAVAVDLDRFGGRLDVVLGVEQEPGWRWAALRDVAGVVDGARLARELPSVAGVAVLGFGGEAAPGRGGALGDDGLQVTSAAWLETVPDVVRGLGQAHRLTTLDMARDDRVIASVAGLADAWVVVIGTQVPQLAAAAMVVPRLRRATGVEPWVVLRGNRVEADVEDAVMDHLDVPVIGSVRDEARIVTDAVVGVAPGARGRGSLVSVADRILLRLLSAPAMTNGAGPAAAGETMQSESRPQPRLGSSEATVAEAPVSDELWRWSA